MILRHLNKKPLNSCLAVIGIGLACSIMMVGNFQEDAVRFMMHVEFQQSQQQDIDINLAEVVADKAIRSLSSIRGVHVVEAQRVLPVRLVNQHRQHKTVIYGLNNPSQLQKILDIDQRPLSIPQEGLLLNHYLAEQLDVEVGDIVAIEVLEGKQQRLSIPVVALAKQFMGTSAYMQRRTLNGLLGEPPSFNRALMAIDESEALNIYRQLQDLPQVTHIGLLKTIISSFYQSLDRVLLIFTFINTLLAGIIAFGVIYNTIRIALAERSRELASLRVLGYRKSEVCYILLGELSLLTLAGVPIGFLLGTGLCQFIAENLQTDIYRIPLVLTPYTYSFSATVVLLSAGLSAAIVIKKIYQMPIVDVLKTRE